MSKRTPSDISYLLMDVDGVLTDGIIAYTADGGEIKQFYVKDGLAIAVAKQMGFGLGIITARTSPIVERRAAELKIDDLFMKQMTKEDAYAAIKSKRRLDDRHIAYIGDDLIDLPVLTRCGFAAAPADADPVVQETADYVCQANGGQGAVREWIVHILKVQKRYDEFLARFQR